MLPSIIKRKNLAFSKFNNFLLLFYYIFCHRVTSYININTQRKIIKVYDAVISFRIHAKNFSAANFKISENESK